MGLLNDRLAGKGVMGTITVYGGSAMVIAWQVRESTRDIDAVFVPAGAIRKESEILGDELGLPRGWLNEGVKGFLAHRGQRKTKKPFLELSNLNIFLPTPEYLLAMKVMAARVGESQEDTSDTIFLIKKMKLKTPLQVFKIVENYYPRKQILPKTQFFVESIFDELSG